MQPKTKDKFFFLIIKFRTKNNVYILSFYFFSLVYNASRKFFIIGSLKYWKSKILEDSNENTQHEIKSSSQNQNTTNKYYLTLDVIITKQKKRIE